MFPNGVSYSRIPPLQSFLPLICLNPKVPFPDFLGVLALDFSLTEGGLSPCGGFDFSLTEGGYNPFGGVLAGIVAVIFADVAFCFASAVLVGRGYNDTPLDLDLTLLAALSLFCLFK